MRKKSIRVTLGYILFTASILIGFRCHGNSTTEIPKILTLEEAADLLRVGPQEVLYRIKTDKLPAREFKVGWRFSSKALLAWLADKDSENAVDIIPQSMIGTNDKMALTELTNTMGRGSTKSEQKIPSEKQPEVIGEKPDLKTADQVFLRDQAVLLKKHQLTLELGLNYSRDENQEILVTSLLDLEMPLVTQVLPAESKSDLYGSIFSIRYGLMDDLQAFASIPLIHRSQSLNIGAQKISDDNETRWGSVTAGLRYAALTEGLGYPSVIIALDGTFPTHDEVFGIGGSIALTKSIDPAVLFLNVGYRHFFNDKEELNTARLNADDTFNISGGVAYALNDTLTLSTSLSASFQSYTRFNENVQLTSHEQFRLRFALTSFLIEGLYIEPFVDFGLNKSSSDVSLGLNIPFTFN